MLCMEYADGKWKDGRIETFGDLKISPAASSLHYGEYIVGNYVWIVLSDKSSTVFYFSHIHFLLYIFCLDLLTIRSSML